MSSNLIRSTTNTMKRFISFFQFLALKPRVVFSILSIRRIKGYTMQTIAGVYQMRDHIKEITINNINGAIVETGCWKGGLGAYMALFGREVWLFDSFEGLPELIEKDIEIADSRGLPLYVKTGYIAVFEKTAHDIARKLGVKPHIIKGWFRDTLPMYKDKIGPIAILRLDGDTYNSTKESLDILYDSVVAGGIIIIDDYYDFSGCRKALYDFFNEHNIAPALQYYPFGRAYFRKER